MTTSTDLPGYNDERDRLYGDGVERLKDAGCWRRFFARSFDVYVDAFVAVVICIVLFLMARAAHIGPIPKGFFIALGLFFLPIVLVVDALLLTIFGNTPGKALMAVHVVNANGERLDGLDYLKRNIRLWVSGYGLGIPIVSLVTMIWQGVRVGKGKPASYDVKAGTRVLSRPVGIVRKIVWVVLALLLFGLSALGQLAGHLKSRGNVGTSYTWQAPAPSPVSGLFNPAVSLQRLHASQS
jgi:uncharacterized RDD family membrane protein YckC